MMATVQIHSLNLKSQIHMDISLQLKQNYQEPALDKKKFSLQIANLWNSLPENVVEAPSTDMFKSRFDRYCRERNLLFDVEIDYIYQCVCTICIAKVNEEIIFDRFTMIVNVVVMGQHYVGDLLNISC